MNEKKECWTCKYQHMPYDSFLGKCTYFVNKGQRPKNIPPHIVDNGCKYYIKKQGKSNKSKSKIGKVLDLFDGKIIP